MKGFKGLRASCYCAFRVIFCAHFPLIPQSFNLRPDFITAFLHNNPARLQLFVIILTCVRSDRPQQAQDVNAVVFNMN